MHNIFVCAMMTMMMMMLLPWLHTYNFQTNSSTDTRTQIQHVFECSQVLCMDWKMECNREHFFGTVLIGWFVFVCQCSIRFCSRSFFISIWLVATWIALKTVLISFKLFMNAIECLEIFSKLEYALYEKLILSVSLHFRNQMKTWQRTFSFYFSFSFSCFLWLPTVSFFLHWKQNTSDWLSWSGENAKLKIQKLVLANKSFILVCVCVCDCSSIIFLALKQMPDIIWRNEDKLMHTNWWLEVLHKMTHETKSQSLVFFSLCNPFGKISWKKRRRRRRRKRQRKR